MGSRDTEIPSPLESIIPENVMLGTKCDQHANGETKIIEFVWIMSIIAEDSVKGDVMARLFAMGKVLFYLFSAGEVPMLEDGTPASLNTSLDFINLSAEADRDYSHAQKKNHRRSANTDYEISDCVALLESTGVPRSLCALIWNLLEC